MEKLLQLFAAVNFLGYLCVAKKRIMEPRIISDQQIGQVRRIVMENCPFVCSRNICVEIRENKIESVEFMGGCSGNTQGIARLLKGMSVEEAINRLDGINCNGKGTSCPDQLAKGLALCFPKE